MRPILPLLLALLRGPAPSPPPLAPPLRTFGPRPHVAPVARPQAVRGIYLSGWAAGSAPRLAALLALADSTEINTFVIDVKEGGVVSYRSAVPLVGEVHADTDEIGDPVALLRTLRAHGIYPIARIVCFRDPILARARPELAIRRRDGALWMDAEEGIPWVDPYDARVWDYNIAIAREALRLGFAEIQWDYVRFPDVPDGVREDLVFPAARGRTRSAAIRDFVRDSRRRLAAFHAPITADVFGRTVAEQGGTGIGQDWEMLAGEADVLLPMLYPALWAPGSYGAPSPAAAPYHIVRAALADALRRTRTLPGRRAEIRPWLQDFTLGSPAYGAREVRAQIQAVEDAGLSGWILWNAASEYTAAALAPREGAALRGSGGGEW